MEPSTTSPAEISAPNDAPPETVTQTAPGELPPLPASPASLLGRSVSSPIPSLTADLRAGPALDDLVSRAVDGARREGSGKVIVWSVAGLLGALLALRVIFDDVLPKLLLVGVLGAVLVAVVALVAWAVIEARRQRALLDVLEHLTRLSQHDAAMRERVGPQVEAVVDALRTPSALLSFVPSRKAT